MTRFTAVAPFVLISACVSGQIVAGQTDRFTADTENWQGANPTWIPTGGPAGNGDGFLQLHSLGGMMAESHMAGYNATQWAGDYIDAGVGAISVDFDNLGENPVVMRLVFFDADESTQWDSLATITVNPGTGWQAFTYTIDPSLFVQVEGSTSFSDTMHDVNRMMFRHDPDPPDSGGTAIVATLGIDNVHAVPVPEPASLASVCLGVAALLRRRRC